jgi:hypothetical protein
MVCLESGGSQPNRSRVNMQARILGMATKQPGQPTSQGKFRKKVAIVAFSAAIIGALGGCGASGGNINRATGSAPGASGVSGALVDQSREWRTILYLIGQRRPNYPVHGSRDSRYLYHYGCRRLAARTKYLCQSRDHRFGRSSHHHNDRARDGDNAQEYALTPANVNTRSFGKLFSCRVDGAIYAQPLWAANLHVNGASHNVTFAATAHNSLFAFEADANPRFQLWSANLIDPAHGGTSGEQPVPSGKTNSFIGSGFGGLSPEVGITGTPRHAVQRYCTPTMRQA